MGGPKVTALALVLAACGGPPVTWEKAIEHLAETPTVEVAVAQASSCPPCPPGVQCEACERPLLVLERGAVVYLASYARDLAPGNVVRLRLSVGSDGAVWADCWQRVRACGARAGPDVVEGVVKRVTACAGCPGVAECPRCEDPAVELADGTTLQLSAYRMLEPGKRYRFEVERTRPGKTGLKATCIAEAPRR